MPYSLLHLSLELSESRVVKHVRLHLRNVGFRGLIGPTALIVKLAPLNLIWLSGQILQLGLLEAASRR